MYCVRMYSIAAYLVSESICDDVHITLYLFVTDRKHVVAAIQFDDIWSYYNYNRNVVI